MVKKKGKIKKLFKSDKKSLWFNSKIKFINYKDINLLKIFLNSNFGIFPSKITNTTHLFQNKIKKYIKYLKFLSIFSYIYKFKF